MNDDERRALYGRPAPGAEPALVEKRATGRTPEPWVEHRLAPEPSPQPVPEPTTEHVPEPEPEPATPAPGRASARRRTAIAVAAALATVAIVAAGIPFVSALTAPRAEPSLAVFDREPTDREREIEQSPAVGTAFGATTVKARLLLSIELEQGGPREVWALRTEDVFWLTPEKDALVCLMTDPTGVGGSGPLSCMLEDDLARRGFIPLEQPRPTVVVDGEIRVIAWGPTGDARLVDPPKPPTDDEES